jgi:hypothetical protein
MTLSKTDELAPLKGVLGVEGFLMTATYRINTSTGGNGAEGAVLISDNASTTDTISPSTHSGDDQALSAS